MLQPTLLRITRPLLVAALALLWAGAASALPATFTFESSTSFDAGFDTITGFLPALPFSGPVGSSDIDEAGGTYDVTLRTFVIALDVLADDVLDAQIITTGFRQQGSFDPGAGARALAGTGSSGSVECNNVGGLGGAVCALVPATVVMWPPVGDSGPTLGVTGAWIDTANGPGYDGTITVNEVFSASGGQLQNVYRYSIVPEPGTMLMLGAGLVGLAAAGRRRA